jgi:glycerol-3-phosphate dehydrogenase (NAD(P)+)
MSEDEISADAEKATRIGIVGAGAWGTALAQVMANAGREVVLWAREPEVVEAIDAEQENKQFLPGITLHENVRATSSLTRATETDIILLVTPAQHVRNTLQALKADLADGKPLVICAKGIETETGYLMSHVAEEEVPLANIAVMSGPTFAGELASGVPSAVTIAAPDNDTGEMLVERLSTRSLRAYYSDDLTSSQIGGAVKNVIAIACGVVYSLGLGESARAALVTRGLAEMGRLAAAMGAKRTTLMGMCGIGDLMLTCTSTQSRNYGLGSDLARGKSVDEILAERGGAVTEGIHTAEALMTMAKNHAVDMPISQAVYECLHEDKDINQAIDQMLERPLKPEGT